MLSPRVASQMLSVAEGPAVDILFKQAQELYFLKDSPSDDLVLNQWPRLDSDSAIVLARAIKNSSVLDTILLKEKRITVLRTIAGNNFLSEVSRLYLFQIGLIRSDRDLTFAAAKGFSVNSIMEMVKNDKSVTYYVKSKDIAVELVKLQDMEISKSAYDLWGDTVLNAFLSNDPKLFLDFVSKYQINIDKELRRTLGRQFNYNYNSPLLSKEIVIELRKLIDKDVIDSYLVNTYDSNLELLASIDPELPKRALSGLGDEITYDLAEAIIKYDAKEVLSRRRVKVDSNKTLDLLIANFPIELILGIIIRNNDQEYCAKIIKDNFDSFVKYEGEDISENDKLVFINKNTQYLGLDILYLFVDKYYKKNKFEYSFIRDFRENQIDFSEVLNNAPANFISKLDEIPRESNYLEVLKLIDKFSTTPSYESILELVGEFIGRDKDLVEEYLFLLNKIAKESSNEKIANFINNCNYVELIKDDLKIIFSKNPSLFKIIVSDRKFSQRDTIVADNIELLSPNSWGQYCANSSYATAIFKELKNHLGDNAQYWETALTFFEDWSGTLSELANAAKNI